MEPTGVQDRTKSLASLLLSLCLLEGIVFNISRTTTVRGLLVSAAAVGAMLLVGCATDGQGGGGPMKSAESCRATKEQLNKLDARGVQALVEAQTRGKKLSASQKADADNYNRLLNDYLGARCHVA
jgi:predicted xylose isomerase-like sugar epimerase